MPMQPFIGFRAPPAFDAKLRSAAAAERVSISEFIRQGIELRMGSGGKAANASPDSVNQPASARAA